MFDPAGEALPALNAEGWCRRAALEALAAGLPFADLVAMLVRDHGA